MSTSPTGVEVEWSIGNQRIEAVQFYGEKSRAIYLTPEMLTNVNWMMQFLRKVLGPDRDK